MHDNCATCHVVCGDTELAFAMQSACFLTVAVKDDIKYIADDVGTTRQLT